MSGLLGDAAIAAYELAFQVSPIILQGGIANGVLGDALPIIQLTGQLVSFVQGIASSGGISAQDFFAQFLPLPGGTAIANDFGNYAFANQQVAGNAIIERPNAISLRMIAPVKDSAGYLTKLAIMTSLVSSLRQHNRAGGTYTVATPALIYDNCVMIGLTDITGGETRQQQIEWQLDFVRPLLSLADAAAAQSSLMQKITTGTQISGIPSWSGATAGLSTAAQGALAGTQGATGLTGAINTFLSSAPTL